MAAWMMTGLFLMMGLIGLVQTWLFDSAQASFQADQSAVLSQINHQLTDWYRNNAWVVDQTADVIPAPNYQARWPVTVLCSQRVSCPGGNQAHKYVIVLPGSAGLRTTMDETTGLISQGAGDAISVVDGCGIETTLLTGTQSKVNNIVVALENYFTASAEGSSGGAGNYFADSGCGGSGNIPCVQGSDATMLSPYIGVGVADCMDGYGNRLLFDNSSAAVSRNVPPFQSRIGINTPWGGTIWVYATGG